MFKKIMDMVVNIFNAVFESETGSPRRRLMARLTPGLKNNDWYSILNGVQIEVLATGWKAARGEKLTMQQTFEKLTDKCFELLDIITLKMKREIKLIGLTSLWRPGDPDTNAHTCGRGIDLGYMIAHGGAKYMFHWDFTAGDEAELQTVMRLTAWETGLLWQWIGPHFIRYNQKYKWIENTGAGDIQKNHRNHVHLTIGT